MLRQVSVRRECYGERPGGADARRLGRGEQADIDTAHHDDEQHQHAPDPAQRAEPLGPGRRRGGWAELGVDPGDHRDRARIEDDAQDAGDDPRGEQLADIGLGHDAVEHQRDAGRDQDAQGAAGGDRAGRQAVGIAEAAHRRHRDLGHGGGGREARPADRAEPAAGNDRRHRQPATAVPEPLVGRLVEVVADPRPGDEIAHQDEQRQHREVVDHRHVGEGVADAPHRRRQADRVGEPRRADDRHAEADRHLEQQQDEQYGEAKDDGFHGLRPGPAAGPGAAARAAPGPSVARAPGRSARRRP